MDLLVLGGTRFVGRHAAAAALSRGHRVTLFHRGRTNTGLFADAESLLGDRDGGLAVLAGRSWDAALDCSGYVPRVVSASAATLAGSVGRYLFVSSISVYAEPHRAGYDESAPLATLAIPDTEEVTGENYGGLKAACERVVQQALGSRATIVRPGLVVGPHDVTDRFPYWPRRLARGGEVLAPGEPGQPVQFIDARDLAAWMVMLLERDVAGTFQATGPAEPLTMGAFLERARTALGADARFTWVDEAFLLEHGVAPWMGLPLWLPAAEASFRTADCRRAEDAGLVFRPLERTVADTLAWERALPADGRDASPALAPAREAELLEQWSARVRH